MMIKKVQANFADSTASDLINYWKLFFIAKGGESYIIIIVISFKDCITHLDGGFFHSC